jgi:predicted nucleic acid binding AN1-type Zn finger protein
MKLMEFTCKYCGGEFCADHHLPENHGCPTLSAHQEEMAPMGEMMIG